MKSLLLKYATPTITGLFLVSLISGIALFFHLGGGLFNSMHEWLSMVLIVPFVLHLWKNWRALKTYFWRVPMLLALILSLAAASAFLVRSSGRAGGPPQVAFAHAVFGHTIGEVAPALGLGADALADRLKAAGFTAVDPAQTLSAIAAKSGKTEFQLAQALLPAS